MVISKRTFEEKLANMAFYHQDEIHLGLCLNDKYDPNVTKYHLSTNLDLRSNWDKSGQWDKFDPF